MNASRLTAAATGTLLALGLLAGAAHATTYNPPIRLAPSGVEYMSGGIGADEEQLMETVSPRWPATFEFAVKDRQKADFAADVRVSVRDLASGATLLNGVKSSGPFMLTRLAPGRYEVDATLGGQTMHRTVVLDGARPVHEFFLWPAGTDTASKG
ncbi:MAG: hypothetical protein QM586_06130 [Xenophilus sp.]